MILDGEVVDPMREGDTLYVGFPGDFLPTSIYIYIYNGCLRYVGHLHLFIGEQ